MGHFHGSPYSAIPHELGDQVGPHKNIAWLYWWVSRIGNNTKDGCFASVATLAEKAHMSQRDVKTGLRWLVENGWLIRESRPGYTSHYYIQMHRHHSVRDGESLAHGPDGTQGSNRPQVSNAQAPGSKRAPGGGGQIGPTNKNPLTKTQEQKQQPVIPPLTPRGGKPAAAGPAQCAPPLSASAPEPPPVAPQIAPEPLPAPPAPSAPPKRVRDPLAGRALPPDAIPADLQHVGQLLTEWWEVKSRGRTTNAFRRACEMLRRFPPQQQQRMLQSAVVGGWQGLHEIDTRPAAGRFMSRQERQDQAVENVINFLAVADPTYAAPSHPQHPGNTPARPGDHAIPITDYSFLDHA